MSRAARLVLPGIPHHVTQRGNSRRQTFFQDSDCALYLSLLRHSCRKSGTAVWAWCLMPNHVHLILVPDHEDGLRKAVAPTHARYAAEINRRENGCGHLWQGRFRSAPMDEAHLHVCFRYIELNPVRAGLAVRPEDWRWSSARGHLGLAGDSLVDPAPAGERIDDWRRFLDGGVDEEELETIRAATRAGRMA